MRAEGRRSIEAVLVLPSASFPLPFFSVWRNLAAHVLREHGAGGSNPPTLTDTFAQVAERQLQRPVEPLAHAAYGGSSPSLRIRGNAERGTQNAELLCRAVGSNGGTLVSKTGSGRFDPCTACW